MWLFNGRRDVIIWSPVRVRTTCKWWLCQTFTTTPFTFTHYTAISFLPLSYLSHIHPVTLPHFMVSPTLHRIGSSPPEKVCHHQLRCCVWNGRTNSFPIECHSHVSYLPLQSLLHLVFDLFCLVHHHHHLGICWFLVLHLIHLFAGGDRNGGLWTLVGGNGQNIRGTCLR